MSSVDVEGGSSAVGHWCRLGGEVSFRGFKVGGQRIGSQRRDVIGVEGEGKQDVDDGGL